MSGQAAPDKGNQFMLKLAGVIVDKRNLIFLITALLLIFSFFPGTGWRWKTPWTPICPKTPRPGRG